MSRGAADGGACAWAVVEDDEDELVLAALAIAVPLIAAAPMAAAAVSLVRMLDIADSLSWYWVSDQH